MAICVLRSFLDVRGIVRLGRHVSQQTRGHIGLVSDSKHASLHSRYVICAANRPKFDDKEPARSKEPYSKPPAKRGIGTNSGKKGTALRLAKVMAEAGVASRRACEDLIEKGQVSVNGKLVTQQGFTVDPDSDTITVSGKKLRVQAKRTKYYFALNKPKGYICSNAETEKGKRVVDLLNPWLEKWAESHKSTGKATLLPPRFFTVGRLDVASHGLIFLTNDGDWAQKVIHPSADITKEYLVLVDKAPSRAQVKGMMDGVIIDGVQVLPEEIGVLESGVKLRIIVSEGKKHESAGMEVTDRRGLDAREADRGFSSGSTSDGSMAMVDVLDQNHGGRGLSESRFGQDGQGSDGAGFSDRGSGAAPLDAAATHALRIPLYDSSLLVVYDEKWGRDMWVWNVGVWQRMQLESTRRDVMARIQPDTYKDGRPKRTKKEPKLEDKGFVPPPSFPNVFPLDKLYAQQPQQQEVSDGVNCGFSGEDKARAWDVSGSRLSMGVTFSGSSDSEEECPGTSMEAQSPGILRRESFDDAGELALEPGLGSRIGGGVTSGGSDACEDEQIQKDERGGGSGEGVAGSNGFEQTAALESDAFCSRDDTDWQVRILVSSVGLEVLGLKRVRIGGFRIPRTLKIGSYKEMSNKEVRNVLQADPTRSTQTSKVPAGTLSKKQREEQQQEDVMNELRASLADDEDFFSDDEDGLLDFEPAGPKVPAKSTSKGGDGGGGSGLKEYRSSESRTRNYGPSRPSSPQGGGRGRGRGRGSTPGGGGGRGRGR